MKPEFTIPDFTYFPILASTYVQPGPGRSKSPPLLLLPENYISDCTKAIAIEWPEIYGEQLTAIYCYEAGRLYDASSEIAKEWLKQNGEEILGSALESDSYNFPKFIQDHAGKEIDELIARWHSEGAEGRRIESSGRTISRQSL